MGRRSPLFPARGPSPAPAAAVIEAMPRRPGNISGHLDDKTPESAFQKQAGIGIYLLAVKLELH